jgi:hypothetical protein
MFFMILSSGVESAMDHWPRRIGNHFRRLANKPRIGANRNFGSVPGRRLAVKAVRILEKRPRPSYNRAMRDKRFTAVFASGAFFLIGGLLASLPQAASASTQTLLDALRKATLGRPLASIASIRTAGRVEVVGLKGTAQEWDDLRNRRFTVAQEAGALSGSNGWDGKVAWSSDYSGLVTVDGGQAGRLQAIDQAYLDNLAYLRPDAGGATIVYAGPQSDGGKTYDLLAVTPPDGSEIRLWIDPKSHLIARETETFGVVSQTTILSNYRRIDGITYPFENSTQTSTGNAETLRLSSLEVNEPVGERMRVPRSTVHDFSVSGGSSTTVPMQLVNNHIYVSVMLDGRGPYTFVVDSGGDYIVTPEVAAAVQAKSAGGVRISGVGSATEGAAFTRVGSIAVGNALVRNQYALVLPIASSFGVAEGMRIDGMLGYQFLARFLTTIDYADSKFTLAMPASAAPPPGAARIGFFIDGTIPRVPIGVDGVTTSAEVDTGNRAGLELSAPFLAAHPTIAALAKTPPGVAGFGVGGPAYARLGRVPSLQIGPFVLANSIASFTYQTQGTFADPFNPANIGAAVLNRFNVTFDYGHQQLLLAKNSQFGAPFTYDRSGLFLIDAKGAHTVLSVLPGTPAAAAGLAKGDVVLTVNGAQASSESLPALRAQLSAPAGTVVRLHIRGPRGVERDTTLKLADYV